MSRRSRSLNLPEPLGPPRPVAGHLYPPTYQTPQKPEELQAGQSTVPIPEEARGFSLLQTVETGSETHPASYSMGTGLPSLSESDQEVMLTFHILVSRIRANNVISLLPLQAFKVWTGTTSRL